MALNDIFKYFDLNQILAFCNSRVKKFGSPHRIFAILSILNHPIAYFIRVYIQKLPESEDIFLRAMSPILCIGLLLNKYWSLKIKKYFSFYWYITVTISLPFIISYLLMKNNFSLEWLVNTAVGLLITVLIVDWLMFLICTTIGTSLGYLIFTLQYGFIEFQVDSKNIYIAVYLYSMIILFCMIFARHKDRFNLNISEVLRKKVSKKTEELEKSLAVKERFLNFVSHEIKGPVHVIDILAADLLEKYNKYSKQEISDTIKQVAGNTKRLAYLINDWMDVSSLSRQSEFKMKKCNFLTLLGNMIQNVEILAQKKNIAVSFAKQDEKDMDAYQIVCDKARIEQVFSNICMNAIKFSPEHSEIIVDLYEYSVESSQGDHVAGLCVSVTDQGRGIDTNNLKLIFELFVQENNSKNNSVNSGLGLGLALAKKIIDKHDGKIWAENNKDALGSSFYFFIPFGIKEDVPIKGCEKHLKTQQPINILFIDDDELCCHACKLIFVKLGYKVKTFTQVEKFFEYLDNVYSKIDIIFVDILMPVLGIDVIQKIRANNKYKNIPIIAQSGLINDRELENIFAFGKIGFVSKPYNINFVQKEIIKMLSLAKEVKR